MGNLKVGDKVRSLVTQIDVRAGELYEVGRIDADGDVWVIDDVGDNWYLTSEEFEILPVTTEAPKDKPAFKIEAGKYYRTRDGRKVGPMNAVESEGYAFYGALVGVGYIKIFQSTGVHGSIYIQNEPDSDLIAEWIDEPVKVAAPVAKPAIVALIENGQPKPSVAPLVHANATLAAKEATRLAGIHKGQEFGVYVLTQKVCEPAPSYKHEWQRFAAKGEKISAIKELRSVTGLGLKSAKDAVDNWIAHDEPYSRIAA